LCCAALRGINRRVRRSNENLAHQPIDLGRMQMRLAIEWWTIRDAVALLAVVFIYRVRWRVIRRAIIIVGLACGAFRAVLDVHF
jgi:hypothetical protein